jgi:hypothetical protein
VASADNQIGKEGAEALAGALKTNTSLQTLSLRCENGGRGGEGRREETSVTEADWKEVRVSAKLFCRLGFLHNMNTLYGESALAAASLQAGREHQGIEPPWTDALTLRYHVRDVHAMQRCVDALTSLACRHQPLVDWPVWRQHEPEF